MQHEVSKYAIKKLYEDTYLIQDYGIGQGSVSMYLLVGKEKALLYDSGYGLLDLRTLVRKITDKPVICVCGHGHMDHALGACQFDEAYLHSADFEVYNKHSSPEFLRMIGYEGIGNRPAKRLLRDPNYAQMIESWAHKKYHVLKPLEDMPYFDLGGRKVSWYLLPGHTQGSVALWDEKYNTVFDGDAAPIGAWLFLEESSTLEVYRKNLKQYVAWLHRNQVERRYTGHSVKPTNVRAVEKLLLCVKKATDKTFLEVPFQSSVGQAVIVFSNGSIVFKKRCVAEQREQR